MSGFNRLKELFDKTNASITTPVKNAYDSVNSWLDEKKEEEDKFYNAQGISPETREMVENVAMNSPTMGVMSPGIYKTVATGLRELEKPTLQDMHKLIEESQPSFYKGKRGIQEMRNDIADAGTLSLKEKGLKDPQDVTMNMLGKKANIVEDLPENVGGFYSPQLRDVFLPKKSTRNIAHHEALHALEDAQTKGKLAELVRTNVLEGIPEEELTKLSPQEALNKLELNHFITSTDKSDPGRVFDLITKPGLTTGEDNSLKQTFQRFYNDPERLKGEKAVNQYKKIMEYLKNSGK